MRVTGEELQHPHSSPRKGHPGSVCGGGKYSIKPPGSCCCSGCVPRCAPGVAIDWPWAAPAAPALARHAQPLPAPAGPTFPCHLLCCDILTPQGPEAPWPLPSPAFSLPAPAQPSQSPPGARATPGIPPGASRSLSAASCLPGFQSCTCLESN